MRKTFVLLCLLILAYCGGHQPPQPPPIQLCGNGQIDPGETHENCPADVPAPPPGKCGDGICGPAENSQNCKKDCPVEPICGDGECNGSETPQSCAKDCDVPEPEPTCDPDNYIFEGCPTIKPNISESHQILGLYIGATGTKDFNFYRFFKLLNEFDYVYFHFDTPWDHKGERAVFEFDPVKKVYNPKKISPEFRKQINNLFRAAGYLKKGVGVTFFSEYCNTAYIGAFQPRYLPWRDNDVKINWGGRILSKNNGGICGNRGEQSPLYRQWTRRLPLDPNVALYTWTNEKDVNTYRPVNILGEGIFAYVDMIIEEYLAGKKEFPDLRTLWRPANEPWRVTVPCKSDDKAYKCLDDGRGNPLDDRWFEYIYGTLKKKGVRNSPTSQYVVEETFRNSGIGGVNFYFSDKTYRNYTSKYNYRYEFHGVEKVKDKSWPAAGGEDVEFFTKTMNMQPKGLLLSNDGDKGERDEPKDYYPRLREIFKWQEQNPDSMFDYKLPSEPVGKCKYKVYELEKYLECIVPEMEREIFQN